MTKAEQELLELIRSDNVFGVTIARPMGGRDLIVTIMRAPFDPTGKVELGIAPTFAQAWASRRLRSPGGRT